MRKYGMRILAAGLLVGLSAVGAEEPDNQAMEQVATTNNNMMGAADLWAGMLEAGMINDEQFRHVQENGCRAARQLRIPRSLWRSRRIGTSWQNRS